MALGIALSSVDIVVGISGVHYILQGLGQIDRALDTTSAKKVKVALEYPDLTGQLGNIQRAGLQTTQALAGVGQELAGLGRLTTQLAANPIRVVQAQQTIREAQQAVTLAGQYRQQLEATRVAVTQSNAASLAGYQQTQQAARASVLAAQQQYQAAQQAGRQSLANAKSQYDVTVNGAKQASASALAAYQQAQAAARQADADVQAGIGNLRTEQSLAIAAGNAVRSAMTTASAATRQANVDLKAYNTALRDEGQVARDLAKVNAEQQTLLLSQARLAAVTPAQLADNYTRGTVAGIQARRVLSSATASPAARVAAAQRIQDNIDVATFRNQQKSNQNLQELNRLATERARLQATLTGKQATTAGALGVAQGSSQGAVAARQAVALAQQDLAAQQQVVGRAAQQVAVLRQTATAAHQHANAVGQAYQAVRAATTQAITAAGTAFQQARTAIQTHLTTVGQAVQAARTGATQAIAVAGQQYQALRQNNANILQGAQQMAQAAAQRAAALMPAARAAGQYLASIPIIANPLGTIYNVLTGILGIGGRVVMGLVDVGRGIFSLGGAALGAVGHVAGFVGNILQLPVISGPVTAGLSLITDNFMKIVTAIGLVVGALAGLSFKEIISEGMAFEQATANVGAVAQYSFLNPKDKAPAGSVGTAGPLMLDVVGLKSQLQELDYITLKLGADTVFSNTEVAQGIEFMLRGGITASEVTETAVRSMLNLATATGGSIESSAGAINDLLGIFELSADQIPHAANIIAGAVNTSRMDLADWTNAMRQVAPVASAIGLSFEDVATGLTLLGQKGFRGEIAGTAFRNMLLYINPRSEPAKEELKQYGLWTSTGMSPIDPEDPDVIAFNDKQRADTRRLAQLKQQLAQQQAAAKPNQSSIMSTQNQIQTLQDQLNHAVAPTSKETGHSVFYDDKGALIPLDQIIQKLSDVSQGMNDVEKSQFYQKVFGTRSGSAALLFSKDDAATFQKTKDLIGSLDVQTLANFKLDTVAGAIELLTGSLKSLASVVFVNWLASPLKAFFMGLVGPVNDFLELMGRVQKGNNLSALFGDKTRGQMGVDQLVLQLKTGNFEAFKGNILAIFPALERFQQFLWPIFRTLQTGRDIVLTFAQALRGEWAGAFTDSINPIVRLAGIWGTYWGKIWRGILDLLQGKVNFSQFITQVVGGFMDLLTQLGGLFSTEGPKLVQLLKDALGWGIDVGKGLWDSTLKPGLDYMLSQLGGWWNSNKGAIGGTIGSMVDFILHGTKDASHDMRKGLFIKDELGQVMYDPKAKEDTPGLLDIAGGLFSSLGGMVNDHRDDILGAGKALGQLLLDGFELIWSDEGLGIGRHLARGLADTFAGLGKGLMGANEGMADFWTNIFQPGTNAGAKPGAKPDTGIGQEFKRAFILLAVDVILILDMLLTSMFNLILLNLKTMIQSIVDITLLMTMGILLLLSKIPGMGPSTSKALADLNTLHTDIQRGIDISFPMIKPGAMTEALFGGKGALDQILNGELVDANGVILTGPNRGKVLGPDGQPIEQTGANAGGAPGTTVVPSGNGADTSGVPGNPPNNPRKPQRTTEDGGGGQFQQNITADRVVVEVHGLGVDEVIDKLYMGLKAKFEAFG